MSGEKRLADLEFAFDKCVAARRTVSELATCVLEVETALDVAVAALEMFRRAQSAQSDELKRLRAELAAANRREAHINQALNEGDGVYRP